MSEHELAELPQGWSWITLGQVLESIEAGKSFKCEERAPLEGEVGVIKVSAVTWGEFDASESKTCMDQERVDPRFFIRSGDFLFSRANTLNLVGACVIVHSTPKNLMLSDKILRLRLVGVEPKWVLYALRTQQGRTEIERLATGNQESMRNIGQDRLKQIRIPLAPPPEQRQIIAEVEKQLTDLEAGTAALKRVHTNLKRFRASVLKAASEGRLIPQEQISRPQSTAPQICAPLETKSIGPFPLPDGWRWTTLGNVLSQIQAGRSFKCEERPPHETEVGVIKVSAVTWGQFNENESKTCMDADRVSPELYVHKGDFLFSRANTIDLVGACAIAQKVTKRVMLSDKTLRLRFSSVEPQWVLWMLRSRHGRNEIEMLATGNQESMRNIGQERIRQIRIPLPPQAEQLRIIAEIDRRASAVEKLNEVTEASLKRGMRLRRAVLTRAFEGRLVPQAPSDEQIMNQLAENPDFGTPSLAAPRSRCPERGGTS